MRILVAGKLPEKEVYIITCKNCSTVFEFERSEGQYVSDQRDGDTIIIDCPFCSKKCYADPTIDRKSKKYTTSDYHNK